MADVRPLRELFAISEFGVSTGEGQVTAQTATIVADLAFALLLAHFKSCLRQITLISRGHWSEALGSTPHPYFCGFCCSVVLLSAISTDLVSKKCSWDTLLYPAYVMVIGWVVDSAKPEGALWSGMRLGGDRPLFASTRLTSASPIPIPHATPHDIL